MKLHRIDTTTAQKDKWGTGKNGWTNGDPNTGVKATSFNASFCDSIQEEICNVIEKSGLTLDSNDNTQLWKVLSTSFGKYLAIANNLSEIAAAGSSAQSSARGNLGLGSASTSSSGDFLPIHGTADAATKLATARKIGGVAFDGTADINLPGVNEEGNQSTTGNAATATKLATAHKINGHLFDGSADINVTAQDIFNIQAVSIASGTDLNTLTTPGIYYNPANANATSALHYPSTNAGSLIVYKDAGSTQIYTEYSSSNGSKPRQYRRGLYQNVWSTWEQVYDTGNPPPATDLSAYMKTSDANAKFVTGVQLGAQASIAKLGDYSQTYQAPNGCVFTGTYVTDGGGKEAAYTTAYYKPIQRCINGTWATISG